MIGRSGGCDHTNVEGFTAQMLNDHYAAISTDQHYKESTPKLTVPDQRICITEIEIFRMLVKLRPTATGLDGIPAWFLRLGAPVFAAFIA